jgi:hypothetical protein
MSVDFPNFQGHLTVISCQVKIWMAMMRILISNSRKGTQCGMFYRDYVMCLLDGNMIHELFSHNCMSCDMRD